ncbi:hypothetical protein Tco_0640645, partial [Tanacetum coccineum]
MISGLMNMEHYLGPYRLSTLGRCKRNVGSIKSRYGGKTNPKKKAKVYLESTVLKESLNPKHRRASQRRRDAWNSGNKDGSRTVQKEDSKALVTIDEEEVKMVGVPIPTKQQETPSFANQQVKTPRENVKSHFTHSQKPKVDKKDLGYGFAVRACFVCGSLNHLIRDCDFHEKRWKEKLIKQCTARASSTKNFSTARQSFNRQTVLTNIVMKVNTVKPIVNRVRPANVFHKTHSPSSRPFKKTTVLRTNFTNQKFNTAKDYPHRALKNKGIVDSGCSRHMTGNKAYLAEFQDFNGGPVAFGGSKGYITGKGKIKTGKLDFEDVCFVKEL